MAHITAAASPTKLCLDFSSVDTFDLKMKEIGRRWILSRDLTNSHFLTTFSCAYDFIDFSEAYACKITAPIPSLDQSVLM